MDFRDLAVAARVLRKSPVFALTAALTIALGIGASTAIFSVANAVLLRPLPYRDPDRVVVACSDMRKRNVRDFPFSNANFIDLREGTRSAFDDLAGVFTFPLTLQREDGTLEQTNAAVVTTNFFRLLGGGIAYGRDFNDEDAVPNPPPPPPGSQQQGTAPARLPVYAILSYEYFQRTVWRRCLGDRTACVSCRSTRTDANHHRRDRTAFPTVFSTRDSGSSCTRHLDREPPGLQRG